MFPWILFLSPRGGRKLSDIEFLSIKTFGSKIVTDENPLSTTGDLATLTASSGKDMYLAAAKVVFYMNATDGQSTGDQVDLLVNGTVVETARASLARSSGITGADSTVVYEFKNVGLKVAATQIIKLEVIAIDATTDVEGFLTCFEEATGESPAIV